MATSTDRTWKVLVLNGAGPGGQDAGRVRSLWGDAHQAGIDATIVDVERGPRPSTRQQLAGLLSQRWDLVYLEGTSTRAALRLIASRLPYVVSAGDPVSGFFHTTVGPWAVPPAAAYERVLLRRSKGFIGWTPYLTGRALALGAPRAATVEGGVDLNAFMPPAEPERAARRASLGLPVDHLVVGVVGSLNWSRRQRYGYGLELVEVLRRVRRSDLSILVIGDGKNRSSLEGRLPASLRDRAVFTGRLGGSDLVSAIGAMDVGFVTQTLDGLGAFRLTTKLPEYLACGVPVAMTPSPGYFDYLSGVGYPLPAAHPGSEQWWEECATWLDTIDSEDVRTRRSPARDLAVRRFDYEESKHRLWEFCLQLLADNRG